MQVVGAIAGLAASVGTLVMRGGGQGVEKFPPEEG
jgi:hypothetical protein